MRVCLPVSLIHHRGTSDALLMMTRLPLRRARSHQTAEDLSLVKVPLPARVT